VVRLRKSCDAPNASAIDASELGLFDNVTVKPRSHGVYASREGAFDGEDPAFRQLEIDFDEDATFTEAESCARVDTRQVAIQPPTRGLDQ